MTLGQAIEELQHAQGAYLTPANNRELLVRSINKALRALMGLHPLRCFRRVFRFISAGPRFVLPQGCAGLVRACVNGRPVTMRGQDFKFMLSGPGDMEKPPFKLYPADNIYDIGVKPVMIEPYFPARVFAYVEGPAPANPWLIVKGYGPDGKTVSVQLTPYSHDDLVNGTVEPVPSPQTFTEITSVTVDANADRYITLCAYDEITKAEISIALYNPRERNPEFRHYELMGMPPGELVEILAEVRMGHVDAVDDSDKLIIDTVEPIEWMIRADWEMKSGETQKANVYRSEAEKWLRAHEATESTVQTKITINSDYYGSPGEISDDAFNI